jgi:hypothetical protein
MAEKQMLGILIRVLMTGDELCGKSRQEMCIKPLSRKKRSCSWFGATVSHRVENGVYTPPCG